MNRLKLRSCQKRDGRLWRVGRLLGDVSKTNTLVLIRYDLNNNYIFISLVTERTIQRRISDSVDFNRDWDDYVNGFGDVDGNYWMGLEEIHQLTTSQNVSLSIDIETFEGEPFTLTLETFFVGNAESNYTMTFSGYSQSSDRVKRDSFTSDNNGMMFTTRDRDNDIWDGINCASEYCRGGWWYSQCGPINLNGNYRGDVPQTVGGIVVKFIDTIGRPSDSKAVKSTEMIIRARVE